MTKIGKRLVDDLYIHLSALGCLDDLEHQVCIQEALQRLVG